MAGACPLQLTGKGGWDMHVVGFDIGGTKCAVLLCKVKPETNGGTVGETGKSSTGGQIEWYERREIATVSDWHLVLDTLCAWANEMLEQFQVSRGDCRIGISCGGPLSADRMRICSPPNLPGWDEVPVVDYLSGKLGMPARLQNDADACALAEWKYGAGKGCSHMIFLTFGTGLGAGLILNGRLYTGAGGCAGEVGHIRMAQDGPVGYGKAGSLEGFCSGGGIRQLAIRRAEEMALEGKRPSYQKSGILEITAKDVAEAAFAGDSAAQAIFAETGRYFGRGLAVLIDILDPEMIVAGSIYARSHELMDAFMEAEIQKEALKFHAESCKIEAARLGEQIGDYGAVMAAVYE